MCLNQQLELSQLQSTQLELCDLHIRYDNLQEKYLTELRRADTEARHADVAEHKLEMYKLVDQSSHRHRRHYSISSDQSSSDGSPSYKHQRHRHKAKKSHKAQVPSSRQEDSYPIASSSKVTLDSEEKVDSIYLEMTPTRTKDGKISAFKVKPM